MHAAQACIHNKTNTHPIHAGGLWSHTDWHAWTVNTLTHTIHAGGLRAHAVQACIDSKYTYTHNTRRWIVGPTAQACIDNNYSYPHNTHRLGVGTRIASMHSQ